MRHVVASYCVYLEETPTRPWVSLYERYVKEKYPNFQLWNTPFPTRAQIFVHGDNVPPRHPQSQSMVTMSVSELEQHLQAVHRRSHAPATSKFPVYPSLHDDVRPMDLRPD